MSTPVKEMNTPALAPENYTRYKVILGGLGIVVPVLVAILFYFHGTFQIPGMADKVKFLPALNAVLNSLTAVCLLAGFYFIRHKQVPQHRAMMGTAFALGSLFLLSYVAYHSQAEQTRFGGTGAIKAVYLFLLASHILLAIVTVALVLFTLYFALTAQFAKHRRIARWTFPIWLYVSVTGVIVYLMIAPYYT